MSWPKKRRSRYRGRRGGRAGQPQRRQVDVGRRRDGALDERIVEIRRAQVGPKVNDLLDLLHDDRVDEGSLAGREVARVRRAEPGGIGLPPRPRSLDSVIAQARPTAHHEFSVHADFLRPQGGSYLTWHRGCWASRV